MRRRDAPRCTGMKPDSRASSASAFEKSPSGPIMTMISLPSKPSSTSLILLRGTLSSSKQYAMSLSVPSSSSLLLAEMNSFTDTGSLTTGMAALRDCLAALVRIFSSRAVLKTLLSECSPITGDIVSIPISHAFSANHSYLSLFFVGHTARCSL